MKDVVAVKIIYDDKNRIFFNFYAELYRLVGLYVEEDPLTDELDIVGEKKKDPSQIILQISDDRVDDEDVIYVDPNQLGQWDMSHRDDRSLETVQNVLGKMGNWSSSHDLNFPGSLLEKILPIYVNNNVLKGAMQLQYYRMKMEEHQETEQIFLDTIKDLERLDISSKYLTYAILYCKQKVNLSCYFQSEKPLDYAINDILRECDMLIGQNPGFSNAKVLKGMICERSNDGLKQAIDAYKDALSQIGEKSYATHIYYWLGLLYQKFNNNQDDAAYAYECSYRLRKKYRNVYKMGFIAEQQKDYLNTLRYYKECVQILEEKLTNNMDPLEIEYYFKTGVLISYHSQRNLEDYGQSIKYGEKMIEFYRREFSEGPNPHFQYIYGSEAKKYQEISRNRMKCKRLYECLAISYRECGDLKKSRHYWDLAEKAENQ